MESPGTYPDSPMDVDEAVYPCKGCGEVRCPRRGDFGSASQSLV